MSLQRLRVRALSSVRFQQQRYYSAPTDNAIPAAKQKYVPTSGTYPKGFVAGTAHAGVKASNTKFDDLTLIASEIPSAGAAVFTTNTFKAAPVTVSKRVLAGLKEKGLRGVIINSGCANAVTGSGGIDDAVAMVNTTDSLFASHDGAQTSRDAQNADGASNSLAPMPTAKTLVMSTGVIGQRLPITKITSKIPEAYASLGNTHDHWLRAARAICTTDTFPKLISRTFTLPSNPGTTYSIAGMTKGAGMIHPNMATLLSVICTDAKVDGRALRMLLREATKTSFNSISIDGDTSTNDTCAIFANGAAAPEGQPEIRFGPLPKGGRGEGQHTPQLPSDSQVEDFHAFRIVLIDFMADLAKLVVRDGEGATKFVTVRVTGASPVVQPYRSASVVAKSVANSIVRSPLVKTALYGKDANWGRILCAIGYSEHKATVLPEYTSVSFIPADGSEELKLLVRGEPEAVDEVRAKEILEMEDLEILVRLNDGMPPATPQTVESMLARGHHRQRDERTKEKLQQELGTGEAVMWTCDFSHEYVTINGDYRT